MDHFSEESLRAGSLLFCPRIGVVDADTERLCAVAVRPVFVVALADATFRRPD
ncbi:MAG: hypothetical protein ACOX0U_05950 [Oscillospiraceae bacterium]